MMTYMQRVDWQLVYHALLKWIGGEGEPSHDSVWLTRFTEWRRIYEECWDVPWRLEDRPERREP